MLALVLDDSRVMRRIIGSILKTNGYDVAEAGNGREGLERLKELSTPDIVLVDWNMPEMNGLEFVRHLRSDARYASVRVIMVTTETEMDQMSVALAAGADDYLLKPVTPDNLGAKLSLGPVAGA